MKIIILLAFSLVLSSAQETQIATTNQIKPVREWTVGFTGQTPNIQAIATFRQLEDDIDTIELDLRGAVLRGGGARKAPSLSLRKQDNGQGFYVAALPFGGTLSLYRKDSYGNHREFIRMSYGGIQVAKDDGDLQETFTGSINPGCSPIVVKGLIVGQECDVKAWGVVWTGHRPLGPDLQSAIKVDQRGRIISITRQLPPQ